MCLAVRAVKRARSAAVRWVNAASVRRSSNGPRAAALGALIITVADCTRCMHALPARTGARPVRHSHRVLYFDQLSFSAARCLGPYYVCNTTTTAAVLDWVAFFLIAAVVAAFSPTEGYFGNLNALPLPAQQDT